MTEARRRRRRKMKTTTTTTTGRGWYAVRLLLDRYFN
jgi:hypothetical protein